MKRRDILRARTASVLLVAQSVGVEVRANYQVCCPFHNDSKPSMKLYPKSESAYCFTCHRSYDTIHFAMLKDRTFEEAVAWINENFKTVDPETEKPVEKKSLALPSIPMIMSMVPSSRKVEISELVDDLWFAVLFENASADEVEYKVYEVLRACRE